MKHTLALLLLLACLHTASANEVSPPVIAMLEDSVDIVSVETGWTRASYEPRLRGVFFKAPDGWQAMCAPDINGLADVCSSENVRHFRNVVTFNGKYRYDMDINGLMERVGCCLDVGWLKVPKIGLAERAEDRTQKYAGWGAEPVRKPVPLTNRSEPVKDVGNWKELKRTISPTPKTWTALAAMVGEMSLCKAGKSDEKRPIVVPWRNTHLAFQQKFVNRKGLNLIEARLSNTYQRDCKQRGGSAGDIPALWPKFWIAFSPGRDAVIHLFKSKIGFDRLELIEFGDFDGDGESEGLFFLSGYNRDGYILLHEKMTRQTKFVWSYH